MHTNGLDPFRAFRVQIQMGMAAALGCVPFWLLGLHEGTQLLLTPCVPLATFAHSRLEVHGVALFCPAI